MSAFDRAFLMVLRHEGPYINDSRDPGGETQFGISKRAYPNVDIAKLTEAEASAIYRRDYWDAIKGDKLPEKIAIAMFDTAVNMGVDKAIRLLQASLRIKQDGMMGPVTLGMVGKPDTLARFTAQRVLAYTGMRNFDLYGAGWITRAVTTALEA